MMDEEVERILQCESLYEVLEVKTDGASPAALRKAYLRKSLLVHPDKSKDPRATVAFQRVAEAYDTLNDPNKKFEYDLLSRSGGARRHGGVDVVEVSADQAFEMFAEAMEQYAREQGIEHERRTTVFDHLASAFLYVDGWINPNAQPAADSNNTGKGKDKDKDKERSSERRGSAARQEHDDEDEEHFDPFASEGGAAWSAPRGEDDTGDDHSFNDEEDHQPKPSEPRSRLQTWARNLTTFGSIVSTASQIIKAQQERQRQLEQQEQQQQQRNMPACGTAPPDH